MTTQSDSADTRDPNASGAESRTVAEEASPFGAPRGSMRRGWRRALYIVLPLATVAIVYFATRDPDDRAAGAAGHNHGAAPDSARAVMLSSEEAHRIGVTYAVAAVTPLTREIRTVGQVTFDETRLRTISPKIDGWVERLHVDFTGQFVTAGTRLLVLYSPMLVTAQEELLLAKKLSADVAEGSDDARRSAEELLTSARRRLAYWDIPASDIAQIERTGEVQRALPLYAPIGGFVVEKNVLQGQRIMAGEALYKIADLSTVWVEGEIFEQDVSSVRLGLRAVAELDALSGEKFLGRITYVYPTLNPETRTVRVRVELPNSRLRLKPGMYATLRLTGDGDAAVLSVPRTAVLSTGERHLVFLKRPDGMLEPRLVEIGMASGDRIEIRRGLAAGDTVVASATFLVDAESNLGTALGGMGNMPGMDMTAPVDRDTSPRPE